MNTVAFSIKVVIDSIPFPIKMPVNAVTFSVELARELFFTLFIGPFRAAIQPIVNSVAFIIQAVFDTVVIPPQINRDFK